jgi:hypothetical protein
MLVGFFMFHIVPNVGHIFIFNDTKKIMFLELKKTDYELKKR